ncbi:MAG TPA: GAF domain-containing protein [Candidatus Deferrimicrobiaceae bacterium]
MKTGSERPAFLLSRVIEICNSNVQIENRLKHVCDFLCKETFADCVCIYGREQRTGLLYPWVSSCMQVNECSRIPFRLRPGEGVAGKAAQKRAPIFFQDVRKIPPSLADPRELRDFTSILSIPVTDDVYLYGVMNLSSAVPAQYSEEEASLMRTVAVEVAGAIRNSRLYHDARKRVSELVTLNEIGRAITSTFQVRDLLGYIAKTTSRLLQADGCTIRLADPGAKGHLKVMVDEGYMRSGIRKELREQGRRLADHIARDLKPILINGPEDSPAWGTLSREGISSYLGLPILSKGKALGVISYYSYSATLTFDMEVVNLMQTVCSQLANMIENATMYREAQQLAQANQDKVQRLSTLYDVARALMSTVKTEPLLQVMLYALTSPTGLNFSRAILFLLSEDGEQLDGRMGMGPRDRREARRLAKIHASLPAGVEGPGEETLRKMLWPDIGQIRIPVTTEGCLVAQAVTEQKAVRTETGCGRADTDVIEGFCAAHASAYATVPLVAKGQARGAIYVDNRFREREITDEDIQVLTMFASEASLAMENAELYENLETALHQVRATQDKLLQSEKLAALGEMAAKIAHEIKNPLTVIGGFAGRIVRKGKSGEMDTATATRYSRIIQKEVQRLERILQETLYFSREMAPNVRSVDVNTEIREVLLMYREELEESRITTVADFAEMLPIISVDPDQFRQVLWNLIGNAVQVMEHGGMLKLATRASFPEEGDGIVILIGDTGGGIPHDVVHNIFNPFFTTKSKGTGLGLPIVHAIVERHGGTIHLDNHEGVGVTFSIYLPRFPKEIGATGRLLDQIRKGGINENGNGARGNPQGA